MPGFINQNFLSQKAAVVEPLVPIVPQQPKRAMHFDGTGYVNVPILTSGVSFPRTLVATITPHVLDGSFDFIVHWNNGPSTIAGLAILNGRLVAQNSPTNYRYGITGILTVGKKIQACVVFPTSDAVDAAIYVDGIDVSSPTLRTGPGYTSTVFGIGGKNSASNTFKGEIHDVRIFDYALTAQQVADLYINPTSELLDTALHIKGETNLDVPNGIDAVYDSSGNENHGTANGGVTTVETADHSFSRRVGYSKRTLLGSNATNHVRLLDSPTATSATIEYMVVLRGNFQVFIGAGAPRYFGITHDGSTQSTNSLGATLQVDGVAKNNRGELYDALSDGLPHRISGAPANISSWDGLFVNGYFPNSGWSSDEGTLIYDVKIDLNSNGTWDHHWRGYGVDDWQDRIGNSHGVVTGCSDTIVPREEVIRGRAMHFDGVAGSIEWVDGAVDLDGVSFACGGWAKSDGGQFRLMQNRGTGGGGAVPGFQISTGGAGGAYDNTYLDDGFGNYVQIPSTAITSIADGNWHMVLLTWDTTTGTASIYEDGVLLGSDTDASLVGANLNGLPMRFGKSNQDSQYFEGDAKDWRIWTGANIPTAAEIIDLADPTKTTSTALDADLHVMGELPLDVANGVDTVPDSLSNATATSGTTTVETAEFSFEELVRKDVLGDDLQYGALPIKDLPWLQKNQNHLVVA